ncbi:MAG: ISNCY family transposase [Dehalococcoidales bacterium]|nr:ISNCY family transposase [Dehalococcoidales bacterium]
MTRGSILEYIEAVKGRYLKASKKDKNDILNEFTRVTGYHRKSAIRVLSCKGRKVRIKKRGRPKKYDSTVMHELKHLWEITDHLCSKRLHPFLPELIAIMKRSSGLVINRGIEDKLAEISPSTIDRLLYPYRQRPGMHRFNTTRPGTLLKNSIPIRTFTDWQENAPGFFEVDLVAHCGESVEGFYLNTLSSVDVATGWIECMGVWGKGQSRVGAAIHYVRQRLPFPMLGLDSDNGSEFINQNLYDYCHRERITFTRSRSYKKNDSCHVEQKNWNVVRRVIGYGRYSSHAALDMLNNVYRLLRLYMNFFQPVMKIVSKTRHGAKVHKLYDEAQTPYQRLIKSGVLAEDKCKELAAIYQSLNPELLLDEINQSLEKLWMLEENTMRSKLYRIHKV